MKESNQEDSKQHNLILKQQAVPNTIVDPNNLDLFYNQTNFDNLQSQRSVETLKYLMLYSLKLMVEFNDSCCICQYRVQVQNLVVCLGLEEKLLLKK
jgi:hypothetical protein